MVHAARRLSLVTEEESIKKASLRIAFATNDQVHINQHFGTAAMFALYELSESHWQLIEMVEYENTQKGHDEKKLTSRIDALLQCHAVYCNAIGTSAIKQLLNNNIQPIKVEPAHEINEILINVNKGLQQVLRSEQVQVTNDSYTENRAKRDIRTQWIHKALLAQTNEQVMASSSKSLPDNGSDDTRLSQLLDEEW